MKENKSPGCNLSLSTRDEVNRVVNKDLVIEGNYFNEVLSRLSGQGQVVAGREIKILH